ncbi:MAG: hypothetical protein WBC21_02130 [Minisyncoccales bacterium]
MKKIVLFYVILGICIFVVAGVCASRYLDRPIFTIEPPDGVSPSEWTPFREGWPAIVEKISVWENGQEQIIEFGNLENPNPEYLEIGRILFPTLHKLNLQARCVFTEERMQEIVKSKNKAVEMVLKQASDFPISQWIEPEDRNYIKTDENGFRILEKLKSVIFVLGDNLAEGQEAHVLIGNERKDGEEKIWWSCWAIQQEKSSELDKTWIDSLNRLMK